MWFAIGKIPGNIMARRIHFAEDELKAPRTADIAFAGTAQRGVINPPSLSVSPAGMRGKRVE